MATFNMYRKFCEAWLSDFHVNGQPDTQADQKTYWLQYFAPLQVVIDRLDISFILYFVLI